MNLNYLVLGVIQVSMIPYIMNIIDEFLEKIAVEDTSLAKDQIFIMRNKSESV